MKKAFRFILAGVVALLAVSCYDDSALQEEIGKLDDRLTKVENTLNEEVADLAALVSQFEALEGKLAAIKVETDEDGVTTLTLSNGTSVALSKNGVLTMVDGGWATVAADGTVNPLGIPVSHDHKLAFKVEGGELKVSYDGTTYESTGVKVSEYTAHVIGSVVPAADGKSVSVTIGDQTLELPLVSSAVATLGLSRDSFFLYYGGKKTVEITAENLNDVYVMNEPAGWKASVEKNNLVITAPKEKIVQQGIAEEEGLVLVHATTDEGKCIVAKIEVSTGLGLAVECDKDGNLVLSNAYTQMTTDEDTGEKVPEFVNYAVGIVDAEIYGDGVQFAEDLSNYGWAEGYSGYMYNYNYAFDFKPYQEVVYEVDKFQTTVSELYGVMSYGDELTYSKSYVVWVAPVDNSNGMPVVDQMQVARYTHVLCQFEVTDVTHKSATLTCNLNGATAFYAGVVYGDYANVALETIMSESELWMYLQQPEYLEWWQGVQLPAGEYTGETAIDLIDLNFGEPLSFGTKYYVYVFPYIAGTVYNNFDEQFAPYVVEITTAELQAGGTATATFGEAVLGYDAVDVEVALSEDAESVYYSFYSVENWTELEDKGDAAIFESLMADCNWPLTYSGPVSGTDLESGETVVLAAVAVGVDGKYGEIVSKSYTTLALPSVKNEALTVTMGEVVADYSTVQVEVTPAEGTTVYWNFYGDATLEYYGTGAELIKQLVSRNVATETFVAKNSYMAQGSTMNLVLLILDAENNYNIVVKPCTTKSYPYNEAVSVELVSAVATANANEYTVTLNVAGASKVAVWSNYSGYTSNFESSVVANAAGTAPSGYQFIDVVDGKAVATVANLGNYRCLYATAFEVTDGALSALAKTTLAVPSANLKEMAQ